VQARGEPQRGPGKHFHGAPLGKKIFEFIVSKWYILAYFTILADGETPKGRGV